MSCQKNSNQVCQAATFAGISAKKSRFMFAIGAVGSTWGVLSAKQLWDSLYDESLSSTGFIIRGSAAMTALALSVANVGLTWDSYKDFQKRKKVFTKHVIMDSQGNEIGWTYNPGTAKDKLKMYKERGAYVMQVQEKIDFAKVQKSLQEKGSQHFQQVEKNQHEL